MAWQKLRMHQMNRRYFDAANRAVAELILRKTGINQGLCLEINAGAGHLGIGLAELSMLDVMLMVNSAELQKQAWRNVARNEMGGRVEVLRGAVSQIPLPDCAVDLVVSKSSVFLWQNRARIFREIYRVLAPGGMACLCGGFETHDLKRQIDTKLEMYYPLVYQQLSDQGWQHRIAEIEAVLEQEDIKPYEINYGDNGIWLLIRKRINTLSAKCPYISAISRPVSERS